MKTESNRSQREKVREQVLADPNRGQLAKKQRQYLKLNQAEASKQRHRGSFQKPSKNTVGKTGQLYKLDQAKTEMKKQRGT